MPDKHNTDHGKQNAQDARNAEAARASFDKAGDQTAEHGKQFADAAREGAKKMADFSQKAAESTKQAMQNGIEIAAQEVREAADRFSKTIGFSGQDSEHLAEQSKQNIEAITRCSTVLSQAFQDASRSLFDLGQKQFQRNLEGLNKLTRAKSVQEFIAYAKANPGKMDYAPQASAHQYI